MTGPDEDEEMADLGGAADSSALQPLQQQRPPPPSLPPAQVGLQWFRCLEE